MRNRQVLAAILRGQWLIEPNYAEASLPIIAQILKGENPFIEGRHHAEDKQSDTAGNKNEGIEILCFSSASGTFQASKYSSFDQAPAGSIAIHRLSGPIMQEDSCGVPGSASLARIIAEADKSENISAHIIRINSPGGQVDGTPTYSDTVKGTTKPVVAFIEGMMCSAAYWGGSSANEIIAGEMTNTIGSIGVYTSLRDYSGWYESLGIKTKDVYAPQSTEKNKPYRDALKGDETALKESLSETADSFIEAIKENRQGKLNLKAGNPFKGATYSARQAKEIGLIDEIGNFDYAVQRASELASQQSATNTSTIKSSDMKLNLKSSWKALIAFFGATVAVGADQVEFDASEENLSRINDALAERETLSQDKTNLTAQVSQLTADLASRDARITELEATIAAYGKKPGADSSSPAAEKTDELGGGSASIVDETADYNQNAMRILNR